MPNEYEIEIVNFNTIEGGIEVFARAWKNGVQLGFGKDGTIDIERFRVLNPPILVDDPLGDIIRPEYIDSQTGSVIPERRLREDPLEAVKQSLVHTVSLVGKEGTQIVAGSVGNTTSTFYPAAGAASPVDGRLSNNFGASGVSWATMHDDTTAGGAYTSNALESLTFLRSYNATGITDLSRCIILFDASIISSGDTIDSATLSLFGQAGDDNLTDSSFLKELAIVSSAPAANNNLAVGDFGSLGTTKLVTNVAVASWSTSAYNDMALNADGLTHVSTATASDGIVKFGTRGENDRSNTSITIDASDRYWGMSAYFADQTGTTNDPKLVVVHSASSAVVYSQDNMTLLGVS